MEGKQLDVSSCPESVAFAELRQGGVACPAPPSIMHIYNNDTLLAQSAALGLPQQFCHPLLVPKGQDPARMQVVEVRARRVLLACPTYQQPYLLQACHTWLEIGVVNHALPFHDCALFHLSRIERLERLALLQPQYGKGGGGLISNQLAKMITEMAFWEI